MLTAAVPTVDAPPSRKREREVSLEPAAPPVTSSVRANSATTLALSFYAAVTLPDIFCIISRPF
jgi:hypothetical protein